MNQLINNNIIKTYSFPDTLSHSEAYKLTVDGQTIPVFATADAHYATLEWDPRQSKSNTLDIKVHTPGHLIKTANITRFTLKTSPSGTEKSRMLTNWNSTPGTPTTYVSWTGSNFNSHAQMEYRTEQFQGQLASGTTAPSPTITAYLPAENSLALARALSKHNIPFELHCYERGRHGLGLAEDMTYDWSQDCVRWIRERFA